MQKYTYIILFVLVFLEKFNSNDKEIDRKVNDKTSSNSVQVSNTDSIKCKNNGTEVIYKSQQSPRIKINFDDLEYPLKEADSYELIIRRFNETKIKEHLGNNNSYNTILLTLHFYYNNYQVSI